jgi:hypothetical protein
MYLEYFSSVVLFTPLANLNFSLLIRTCWPTLNLAGARRTEVCLAFILCHIFSISVSVTFERAMPVVL